ncbi:hypothetical protein E2C01_002901 [Portunus trituberculatus]|uniref:Uncharacterized protein n=1 Tax=Portunus trituberculatus TaxID=210409 RepID=A0A5B7CL45_PORTR|nr:hypothetical protein [Portunus trituberculatus]
MRRVVVKAGMVTYWFAVLWWFTLVSRFGVADICREYANTSSVRVCQDKAAEALNTYNTITTTTSTTTVGRLGGTRVVGQNTAEGWRVASWASRLEYCGTPYITEESHRRPSQCAETLTLASHNN